MMKKKFYNKGFTLIEAMVAISILSLAVTAPLIIAQKGIGSAIYARDEIPAFYLAQEAVEYIRNARDTNRIAQASWLRGLSNCLVSSGAERCTIDARNNYLDTNGNPNAAAVASCTNGACPVISYDSSSGFYGYNFGTPTKFTRSIFIDTRAVPNQNVQEAVVSVTVSWTTNLSFNQSFTVKEYIFNF